ncbi:hypothetical protein AcW1_008967 [Taiwanofungus camphoratus]|nr:hypothetical protein AcW1_008964 [Antrodia cinnamomea]KAI0949319.1 hypothetical protein AcW1_008967 [Antrodia cinnamomea]
MGRKRAPSNSQSEEKAAVKRKKSDTQVDATVEEQSEQTHIPLKFDKSSLKQGRQSRPPVINATSDTESVSQSKVLTMSDVVSSARQNAYNEAHSGEKEEDEEDEQFMPSSGGSEACSNEGDQSNSDDDALEHLMDNPAALKNTFDSEQASWVEGYESEDEDILDQLPPVSRARKTSTTSISSLEMGTFDLSDSVDALVTEHELTSTLNKPPQHNRSEHYVRCVSGVQTPASKQVTKGLQSPTQPVQTSSDDKRTVSSSRSQTLKTQKTNHTISNKSWVHQTHRGNHQLIEEPVWRDTTKQEDSSSQVIHKHQREHAGQRGLREMLHKRPSTPIDLTVNDDDNDIEVIYPDRNGPLSLTAQRQRVQKVLRTAIDKILAFICFNHAFPESLALQSFTKTALMDCAHSLGFEDIVLRLKNDSRYADDLTTVPIQRVYNFRSALKSKTDLLVPGHYGCKPGCSEIVEWLLYDSHYLYQCKPETRTFLSNKPFLHDGIVAGLNQAFFNGRASIGMKNLHLFSSSLPEKPDEKELPKAMCALMGASTRSSISEWVSGTHKADEFTADRAVDAYNEAFVLLERIQQEGPLQYHALMHRLFTMASGISSNAKPGNAASVTGAAAIVDIAGMDV